MVGKAAYGLNVGLPAERQQRPVSFALARFAVILVLVVAALTAIAGSLLLLYGWTHNDTVFDGVTVTGADLGGLNQQQAASRIEDRVQQSAPRQIVLTFDGQSWPVAASSLGITYDAQATAAKALQVGHSGSLWKRSRDWMNTLASGDQVPVEFRLDNQAVYSSLQAVSGSIIRPPENASYVFTSPGSLAIHDATPGIAIDVAATADAIRAEVGALSSASVEIKTFEVKPAIDDHALEPGLRKANAMVSAPFVLTSGGTKWEIPPETLRQMLVLNTSGGESPAEISAGALASYVAQIADQVKAPGRNAAVSWDNGQFVVSASTEGTTLDAAKTAQAVVAALADDNHTASVAVTSTPAAVVDADARDAADRAQQLISQTFTLNWSGGSQDLSSAQLGPILAFSAQPDQNPKISIGIDHDAVAALLDSLRSKVEVPAQNANLRYVDGKVTVVSAEKTGTQLNVDASAQVIEQALTTGAHNANLATDPVQPTVTAAMATSIAINQKLSSGQTYYGGSVANRAFNVNLAVERVNGALIPPGATFSFDDTVGAVDTEHGYKLGYGIEATSNGGVTTVPSVGGGICQVATTLFHAAFWAGMPIVQRSWHLYWIPLYGQAPSGITGLDATIDTDAGLDLKFKNTTDNWLAVVATADGTWVRFELWGTDPGWTVKADDPVVTNVVKADTAMQIEKSDQLPAGTSVLVEHAQDGFDVSIHRQVLDKDGKLLDDLTLKSHYVPSANVTLQGTGT